MLSAGLACHLSDVTILNAHAAGDVKLVLEAKVDVRDGLAWSSLDKYIKNLEGSGSAPSGPSGLHDSQAAAAAAVAGAADSDEDAEPGDNLLRLTYTLPHCNCSRIQQGL